MEEIEFIEIKEVYLKSDRTAGNMVILKESENAKYYFLMFVGDAEATAIAKEKGLLDIKRPLTHEFYLNILREAGVKFERVEIWDMKENTYYARVFFKVGDEEKIIDARPSDSVALALHEDIPILVNKKLFRRELTPEEVKEYEEICKSVKF